MKHELPKPLVTQSNELPVTQSEDLHLEFQREAQQLLDALHHWEGVWEKYEVGVPSNKVTQLRNAMQTFLNPYREGRASFQDVLKNPNTSHKMVEVIKRIYYVYKQQINPLERREMEKTVDDGYDFLSSQIAISLDCFDQELSRIDLDPIELQRFKNNIFYSVSEALDTQDAGIRDVLSGWLAEHVEEVCAIQSPDQAVHDTKQIEDDGIVYLTKKNIIKRVEDDEVARKVTQNELFGDAGKETSQSLRERVFTVFGVLYACRPNDSNLARRKEIVVNEIIRRYGLDPMIVKKWREVGQLHHKEKDKLGIETEVYYESFAENVYALAWLESQRPGAAQELFEKYGIANYGRYPLDMLIRQLDIENENVSYGIAAYPEADWNGAMFHIKRVLDNANSQLQGGGYIIRIVEASSQRDLARRLLRLHRKYSPAGKKFSFAIVPVHGLPTSVEFGNIRKMPERDENMPYEEHKERLKLWLQRVTNDKGGFESEDFLRGIGIGRALNDWFELDAPKVLISCSTGVKGGIAETISAHSSGEVIAPTIPTNVERIDVSFDGFSRPQFHVEYQMGEAKQYVAGISKE